MSGTLKPPAQTINELGCDAVLSQMHLHKFCSYAAFILGVPMQLW